MADPFKLAFTDAEELERQIEEYFESRMETRTIRQIGRDGQTIEFEEEYMRPPTMAGLARWLGVVRQTLLNYRKRGEPGDQIGPVITRALNRIAEWAEEALYTREGVTGARFSLEVNHGYGQEGGNAGGDQFVQQLIPPAAAEQRAAIPKWGDEPAEITDVD